MNCKHQTLHAHVRKSTHEHSFSQANNFPFERSLWEHLRRNIWEWQEIRHLSVWLAMYVFQALQRDGRSTERRNLQTQTEFMEASSGWFSLPRVIFQTNGMILVFCIITFIWCFHNMPTTLFQLLLTKHMAWCAVMEVAKEDFHAINFYILALSLLFILPKILKVFMWNKTTYSG